MRTTDKRFALGFGWLAAWLTVLPGSWAVAQKPPEGPPSQPVVAAVVSQQTLKITQTFVGTVVATRTSKVGSPVEGRVTGLLVEEGDHVRKGDTLAQLRTESLEIQLAAAAAERALLEQDLERLRIAQPKEIAQAAARKAAAEALKAFAEARLKRFESLPEEVVTDEEMENVFLAVTSATKILDERTAGLDLAVATEPLDIIRAETRLQVQAEKIRQLKDDIAEHTIVAPFDGYVTEEYTEVGQWIAKGGPVVEVVERDESDQSGESDKSDKIDIELPVLESHIAELKVREAPDRPGTGTMTTRVEVAACPGVEFQGEVVSVVPKADLNSRTFPVKVRVKNCSGPNGAILKPGMFARVTLPVREVPGALMVPKDALNLGEGATTVWMIRKAADFQESKLGQPALIPVTTGEEDEGLIQVSPLDSVGKDLLKSGQLVIVEGNERINPKLLVRVIGRD
ncbi:MAG: efflux RND transporter periplasmic adaptor subunit [Planctomycetes bacterium]|nr:efflux RND transporter periplasmic adaptor subunit [Planctomycetota bacterium]